MTMVRTLATHEVVRHLYPREPATEVEEIARATGKAVDHALSQWSHLHRQNLRPTAASISRAARETLEEELRDADVVPTAEQRELALRQITGVLQAFRKSPLFGLSRPRSHLLLIDGDVGVYAQPDFWDPSRCFYEMKTFRAVPPSAEVALQVNLFQLAFPGLVSYLACFDRYRDPVETTIAEVPPLSRERVKELLAQARRIGQEIGQEKVLEYIDLQKVAYSTVGAP